MLFSFCVVAVVKVGDVNVTKKGLMYFVLCLIKNSDDNYDKADYNYAILSNGDKKN